MSAVNVRLPKSLHAAVRALAAEEGISINQLISQAVAEKVAALKTEDYLKTRAARADRAKFEAALAKVPDVEPEEWDKLDN